MKNSILHSTLKLSIIFTIVLFLLSNVNAAGVLDTTFGTNGRVTTTVGASAQANAFMIQPDGKIIVAGHAIRSDTNRDIVLVRYNSNGTLDASFGEGGKAYVAITRYQIAYAIALQPDGKIVVAGNIYSPQTDSTDFLVARLTSNGTLDTTFGNNGAVSINQGSYDIFNSVAVQPDGKIVAAGRTSDGDRVAVLRLNSNGSLDSTFSGGLRLIEVIGYTAEGIAKIVLLNDGRILAGGLGNVSIPHSGLASFFISLDSNGLLSQNFGTFGVVTFWDGFLTPGFDFELLPDGKILAVADRTYRFLSNGTRDTSFTGNSAGGELAVYSNERYIVGGSFISNEETRLFTEGGRFIGSAKNLPATETIIQPDGKTIFLGSTQTEFIVVRINSITSQGTRIANFDNDEKTDIAVLRPSNSTVYVLRNIGGYVFYNSGEPSFIEMRVIPEKFASQFPLVYWKPQNILSLPGSFCGSSGTGSRTCLTWGRSSDLPVGGDYSGDGYTDYTVFRPSDGTWQVRYGSEANQSFGIYWGTLGDKPVPADYDYDGITDIAIYRPSTGTWWIRRSSDGTHFGVQFGASTDVPLTGDYDGDGRADFVVYRPGNGVWYQFLTTEGFKAVQFGLPTDKPVPGDYDGDGRHDIAVFRQGVWYLLQSTEGFKAIQFGNANDIPVSVRYDE